MNAGSPPAVVPFNDLGRGTSALRAELDEAIGRVVASGWFVLGPEHDAFQSELAAYLGVQYALGVGNGTDALQLALTALGVVRGDAVLTVANAGGYTSTAVRALGAEPVYADVDPVTLLLDRDTVAATVDRLGRLPAAIVVTHLFGSTADAAGIVEWARERSIPVVEDCAQSLGARVGDTMAGAFGDIATTSFYPTKNLGALGDGGAVLTNDDALAARVRSLRQYGWSTKYRAETAGGINSRLDELQAAVLRVKLPHLDAWNQRRRDIHRRYEEAVGPGGRLVNTAGESYVGHLAVLDCDDRAHAQSLLAEHAVAWDIHYPIPDHRQPLVADLPQPSLPATERAAERILSVPLFPELSDDEVARVAQVLAAL